MGAVWSARFDDWLSYDSVRFIRVKNWRLGAAFWSLRLAILLYVVVYSIILKKGYQDYDQLIGAISLKVKGSGYSGSGSSRVVYDAAELVLPATEPNALFIATTRIQTKNQTRGICDGNDPDTELCSNGCKYGNFTPNGMTTGICGVGGTYCQVQAWCPTESPTDPGTSIEGVNTWATFVRVSVQFPGFGVTRTNIDNGLQNNFNLFTNDYILQQAGTTYDAIKKKGAIILVIIKFDCDLDKPEGQCQPTFKFVRTDPPSQFSTGFNYRYAVFDGSDKRDQFKVTGLRIFFSVSGTAGKFGFVPMALTFGAGIALLGISTLICDLLLQYVLPLKDRANSNKFQDVGTEDDAVRNNDAFLNARSFDEKHNDNRRNDRLEMQPTIAKTVGQSQQPPVAVATPVDNTTSVGHSNGHGNDSNGNGSDSGNGNGVTKTPSVETQLFPNDNTPPVGPSPMSSNRPLDPLLPVGSDQVTLTVV